MVARVRPVGVDTLPPHQGRRDFALGCSGHRPVKRLEDKAQTAAPRFGWKQPIRELSGRAKSIETFEPIHPMS